VSWSRRRVSRNGRPSRHPPCPGRVRALRRPAADPCSQPQALRRRSSVAKACLCSAGVRWRWLVTRRRRQRPGWRGARVRWARWRPPGEGAGAVVGSSWATDRPVAICAGMAPRARASAAGRRASSAVVQARKTVLTAARTTSITEMMVVAWVTWGPRDQPVEVAWRINTTTRPLVVAVMLKTLSGSRRGRPDLMAYGRNTRPTEVHPGQAAQGVTGCSCSATTSADQRADLFGGVPDPWSPGPTRPSIRLRLHDPRLVPGMGTRRGPPDLIPEETGAVWAPCRTPS